MDIKSPSIDYITPWTQKAHSHRLGLLRLDEINPVISGNKWFKLSENISTARNEGKSELLTFGGAYSNHLVATAKAAHDLGWGAIGFVRGLHAQTNDTPTLAACRSFGMRLHFLDREAYGQKDDASFLERLVRSYPKAHIVPEGGNNEAGRKGASSIVGHLPIDVGFVAVAMGTGTTFHGICDALPGPATALGFPALKGGAYLAANELERPNGRLYTDYHFGGFARHTPELLSFMDRFYIEYGIPLDFVYTAKMMFGVFDLLDKGLVPEGGPIVCIHTGGLQGNASLGQRLVQNCKNAC